MKSLLLIILLPVLSIFTACYASDVIQVTESPSGYWTAKLSSLNGPDGSYLILNIYSWRDEPFCQQLFTDIPANTPVEMIWDSSNHLWFFEKHDRSRVFCWEYTEEEWRRYRCNISLARFFIR